VEVGDAGAEARRRARAGGVAVKCFCARLWKRGDERAGGGMYWHGAAWMDTGAV
jgi:hypothetical protein